MYFLLKQKSINPRAAFFAAGLWASQAWLFWINTKIGNQVNTHWYLDIYAALTVAFLVFFFLFQAKSVSAKTERVVDALACAAMIASTISIELAGKDNLSLTAAFVAIGAVGLAWSYTRWGLCFGNFDTRTALGILFLVFALGSVAKTVLSFLPAAVAYPFAAALPLVSFTTLRKAINEVPESKSTDLFNREGFSSLWKPIVCVAVFSFVCASMRVPQLAVTDVATPYFLAGRTVELAFSLIVLYWVFRRNGSFGFSQLWGFVFLFLSAALLLYLTTDYMQMCSMFSGIALSLIIAYLWLVLTDIAHHSRIHPYVIFSGGYAIYTLSRFTANAFFKLGDHSALPVDVAGLLLYLLIVAIVLILNSSDIFTKRLFSDLDDANPTIADYELIDERCIACKERYGLSDREIEVLQLLCKGRSKAYIAETLFVTENTIRSHTKRIYTKLNVHSKSELQKTILGD